MVILCDFDDVLFPLIPPWVKAVNDTFNTNMLPEQITAWDIEQFFPPLTRTEIFSVLTKDFWRTLEPAKDGVEFIEKVLRDGHILKVVTATHYKDAEIKIERMLECYPLLSWKDVIITHNKQMIQGDVLIDDGPHNLIGGNYKGILFNSFHNRRFDTKTHGISRCNTLMEACKIINNILVFPPAITNWGTIVSFQHDSEIIQAI